MTTALLLALTILCWGIAPIFDKAALRRGDPFLGMALRGVIIGICMLAVLLLSGKAKEIALMPKQSALFFSISGILAGLIGVLTYFKALQYAPTSKIVPLAATYPLVTALLSILFLGESLTALRFLGIVLIIAGIWLVK